MTVRPHRSLFLLVVLAVAGTACGGGESGVEPPAREEVVRREESRPAGPARPGNQPGRQAPDFRLTTTDGQPFRLSSLRGQAVVVDFLAPG